MLLWPAVAIIFTFKSFQVDLQQSKTKVTCHFKFAGGLTAPSKINPTRLPMSKSTGVDLLGSTPRSAQRYGLLAMLVDKIYAKYMTAASHAVIGSKMPISVHCKY